MLVIIGILVLLGVFVIILDILGFTKNIERSLSSRRHTVQEWEQRFIDSTNKDVSSLIVAEQKKAPDLQKQDSVLPIQEQEAIPEFFPKKTKSMSSYDYRDFALDMNRVRLPNGRTKIELEKELPNDITKGLTQLQVHTLYTVLSGLFEIKVGFVGGQDTLNCMYDIDSEVLDILNKLGLDCKQDKYDITYLSLQAGKDLRDWPTLEPKPRLSLVK